eukprot:jgi/Chlat1/7958/Chrsp69S09184
MEDWWLSHQSSIVQLRPQGTLWLLLAITTTTLHYRPPAGNYALQAAIDGQGHLFIEGASDLEIVATGVTITCMNRTRAVQMSGCRNVVLRGPTIDYHPSAFAFTQGTVIAVDPQYRSTLMSSCTTGIPRPPILSALRLWGAWVEALLDDVVRVHKDDIGLTAIVNSYIVMSANAGPAWESPWP